jgi:purine-binding chemotaxis protein CheW
MTMLTNSAVNAQDYVTATIGEQLFGLPIERVQDVFAVDRLTRVPLAKDDIAGVFNLRGRIVTVVDMRRRLDMPVRSSSAMPMAIGVECKGESYGLLIDEIGEVLSLTRDSYEPNPVNLDAALAAVSLGVHRLEGSVLVVLDVDRVLDLGQKRAAA